MASSSSPPAPGGDAPKAVMIVEDEALIAFGLEDAFADDGFRVVGPFSSCAAALSSLAEAAPAVAVVDATLSDGPCLDLARELLRRGVPFLIYSGRAAFEEHAPELEGIPWVEKPSGADVVIAAARRLLAPG